MLAAAETPEAQVRQVRPLVEKTPEPLLPVLSAADYELAFRVASTGIHATAGYATGTRKEPLDSRDENHTFVIPAF